VISTRLLIGGLCPQEMAISSRSVDSWILPLNGLIIWVLPRQFSLINGLLPRRWYDYWALPCQLLIIGLYPIGDLIIGLYPVNG